MAMSNKTVISIKNALSTSDLALRTFADNFFDFVEAIDSKIIAIDFSGISSISRSFAHQYITRKEDSSKKITEINVPLNVEKMLEIVKLPKTETVFEVEKIRPLHA